MIPILPDDDPREALSTLKTNIKVKAASIQYDASNKSAAAKENIAKKTGIRSNALVY